MDYIGLYTNFLKKFIKIKKPLKVVFDCSNGTTGIIIEKLKIKDKRLKILLINERPDGNFPAHGPNPSNKGALEDLKKAVLKFKADLGVIFDGDGDRTFFIDDQAKIINSDIVIALISRNFKGSILLDICCGYLARELISADKKKIIDSRLGHYFIKKLMRKRKINFGAEVSGHYYFKDFFYSDSGILAAILMMNQVSSIKCQVARISGEIDKLPRYYQSGEINFRLKEDTKEIFKLLEKKYKSQAQRILRIDGLRMEFDSPAGEWWFNLRFSNTEDLIRLNVEAKNQKLLKFKITEIKKVILDLAN